MKMQVISLLLLLHQQNLGHRPLSPCHKANVCQCKTCQSARGQHIIPATSLIWPQCIMRGTVKVPQKELSELPTEWWRPIFFEAWPSRTQIFYSLHGIQSPFCYFWQYVQNLLFEPDSHQEQVQGQTVDYGLGAMHFCILWKGVATEEFWECCWRQSHKKTRSPHSISSIKCWTKECPLDTSKLFHRVGSKSAAKLAMIRRNLYAMLEMNAWCVESVF